MSIKRTVQKKKLKSTSQFILSLFFNIKSIWFSFVFPCIITCFQFILDFFFNFKTNILLFLLRYWNLYLRKKSIISTLFLFPWKCCALWEKGLSLQQFSWLKSSILFHSVILNRRKKYSEKMRKWNIFPLTSNEIDFQHLFDYSI